MSVDDAPPLPDEQQACRCGHPVNLHARSAGCVGGQRQVCPCNEFRGDTAVRLANGDEERAS